MDQHNRFHGNNLIRVVDTISFMELIFIRLPDKMNHTTNLIRLKDTLNSIDIILLDFVETQRVIEITESDRLTPWVSSK